MCTYDNHSNVLVQSSLYLSTSVKHDAFVGYTGMGCYSLCKILSMKPPFCQLRLAPSLYIDIHH